MPCITCFSNPINWSRFICPLNILWSSFLNINFIYLNIFRSSFLSSNFLYQITLWILHVSHLGYNCYGKPIFRIRKKKPIIRSDITLNHNLMRQTNGRKLLIFFFTFIIFWAKLAGQLIFISSAINHTKSTSNLVILSKLLVKLYKVSCKIQQFYWIEYNYMCDNIYYTRNIN